MKTSFVNFAAVIALLVLVLPGAAFGQYTSISASPSSEDLNSGPTLVTVNVTLQDPLDDDFSFDANEQCAYTGGALDITISDCETDNNDTFHFNITIDSNAPTGLIDLPFNVPVDSGGTKLVRVPFTINTAGGGGGGGTGAVPPGRFFGGGIPEGPQTGETFLELIENITDWIFVVVLLFSVIFIVLAGWQFITGGGDAAAVSQARNKLLYAAIGIAVAIVARAIPVVVRNIIGS